MIHNKEDLLKNKDDIKAWLEQYDIEKYTINEDMTVDVDQDIILTNRNITNIMVQFGKINGFFLCNKTGLLSLIGCAHTILGDFDCSDNLLRSLIGGPKYVGRNFNCSDTYLKSLEGCPIIINGNFYCEQNQLITLEYSPLEVE